MCDKGYIWNPSNCECECDKSCNVGEYLDYENCNCRKEWLIDPIVKECTENIKETKLTNITIVENENNYEHNSCIVYTMLMIVFFIISTGITFYLVYYNWSLIKNNTNKNLMGAII